MHSPSLNHPRGRISSQRSLFFLLIFHIYRSSDRNALTTTASDIAHLFLFTEFLTVFHYIKSIKNQCHLKFFADRGFLISVATVSIGNQIIPATYHVITSSKDFFFKLVSRNLTSVVSFFLLSLFCDATR